MLSRAGRQVADGPDEVHLESIAKLELKRRAAPAPAAAPAH